MDTKVKDLSAVLFSERNARFLLSFLNSDKESYLPEVVRLKRTRQAAIRDEFKNFAEAENLKAEKWSRQKFCGVNRRHPILQDLSNIIFRTFSGVGKIREVIEPLSKKIEFAFVPDKIQLDELVGTLSNVEKAVGREINSTPFSITGFKKKWFQKNHFLRSVAKAKKKYVVGSENVFRRLAE